MIHCKSLVKPQQVDPLSRKYGVYTGLCQMVPPSTQVLLGSVADEEESPCFLVEPA